MKRKYNSAYTGDRLNRIAFPLGGIGAGMVCLEGTGALSHVSVRNKPDVFNEPCIFSALRVQDCVPRVLEGPVPGWKVFGKPGTGNGASGMSYGFPRFDNAVFSARFPFATVSLKDQRMPFSAEVKGWSPFIPGDSDNSSLPAAALEYSFTNNSGRRLDAVYSFNARHFMAADAKTAVVESVENGFMLNQPPPEGKPWERGSFSAVLLGDKAEARPWFKDNWFNPMVMAWNRIESDGWRKCPALAAACDAPGGSIYLPFTLEPGASRTVRLLFSWYVPETDLRIGEKPAEPCGAGCACKAADAKKETHKPWYSARFPDARSVLKYWTANYERLRAETSDFSDCFYDTTLPPEVIEAVAANLTILKSPTVLRQADGRLWCFEGCCDGGGCCHGSCTHVWNYAQALPHLFPDLERSLRLTEFNECQDERGHQNFRAFLPIRPADHNGHAAADGQLGGIMKVHRDWRISGDTNWLRALWPKVKQSLEYCIETWDPDHKGLLVEPHHNTFDIEFWGPDGMCNGFYLGALKAAAIMGRALGEDVAQYEKLLKAGRKAMEDRLFNGEYFHQLVQWEGLRAQSNVGRNPDLSAEEREIEKEGPKFQYGTGCLSECVVGAWMAHVCGLGDILSRGKVRRSLQAIYKNNFKKDLSDHANPQRPAYALGHEGGLLICTWPRGGKLSLPFPYTNEVFTGSEYHVASHLIMEGMVNKGLEIVRTARDRYDGRIRNPFNEYECGHWYARAMSSYGLLQGLAGARYDALEKTLHIKPAVKGDFRSFLCTATGYGTVGLKAGKPFIEVKKGSIEAARIVME